MTEFFCCEEFKQYCCDEGFTPKEIVEANGFKICPFRGHRIV